MNDEFNCDGLTKTQQECLDLRNNCYEMREFIKKVAGLSSCIQAYQLIVDANKILNSLEAK